MMYLERKWIIWWAVIVHFVWGILLLVDVSPLGITAIHEFALLGLPRYVISALFIVAAAMSTWGLVHKPKSDIIRILYLLPQQMLLVISAVGAAKAMWLSQFADGVIRPREFLIADQMPVILTAIFHTLAILEFNPASWKNGFLSLFRSSQD